MRATTGVVSFVLSVLLLLPLPAVAQQMAEIEGKVVDPDGLGIPGATVTATNDGTGLVRTSVTGPAGSYVINLMPPGTYTILVEMSGFLRVTRTGVKLQAGQQATFDWKMQLGALEEAVTVLGDAPLVDRSSNTVGGTLSEREMEEVPSNFRNFTALTALVPGITPSPATSSFEGGSVSANGSPSNSNVYLIDGTYNNDDRLGSNAPQVRVVLDTITEYQVLGNQYSVEYGGGVGAIMNMVTRGGTNTFAGRVYTYFRDDKLNTRSAFLKEGVAKPDERTLQTGFAIGGPIVRNRAHFQFSFERDREVLAGFKGMPAIAAPLARDFLAEFEVTAYNAFARGDVQITGNMFANARYIVETAATVGEQHHEDPSLPDSKRLEGDYDDVLNVSITNVLGDRASNVLRIGRITENLAGSGSRADYYKEKVTQRNWFRGFDGRDQFDIGQLNTHPAYWAGRGGAGAYTEIYTHTFDNTFSYFKPTKMGDHTLKAGGGYSTHAADPRSTVDSGNFVFTTDRPFDPANRATYPTEFTSQIGPAGVNTFDVVSRDHRYYAFFEDRWRPANRVTLNLGVRYDYQHLTSDSKNDFAPRVGVVWDMAGNGKTVIRGGFGRFNTTVPIALELDLLQSGLITKFPTITITDPTSPVLNPDMITDSAGNPGVAVLSAAGKATLRALRDQLLTGQIFSRDPLVDGRDLQMMYTLGWSAGVARELAGGMAITADYVANVSRDQLGRIDINEPVNGVRPGVGVIDPNAEIIPDIARRTNFRRVLQYQTREEFNGDYKSLQIGLVKRYANRWSMRHAYTLQRGNYVGLGNQGGRRVWLDNDLRADYGRFAGDRKHVLVMSGTVSPWSTLTIAATMSALSGLPINETVGRDRNADTDSNNDRPVAGVDDLLMPIRSALDSQGRAVINGLEGPGTFDVALSFRYAVPLGGVRHLDLSWDIFNVTNRLNFQNPTGNRASDLFMVPNTVSFPRQMQLGVRFRF
jgi:hypothetical protein